VESVYSAVRTESLYKTDALRFYHSGFCPYSRSEATDNFVLSAYVLSFQTRTLVSLGGWNVRVNNRGSSVKTAAKKIKIVTFFLEISTGFIIMQIHKGFI
jgi:hypothetical protein